MIPHIPRQRLVKNVSQPFNDLVSYIEEQNTKEPLLRTSGIFGDIVEYAINPTDGLTSADKCIAIRTNGVLDISTAGAEMNAVAMKNSRCDSPAYHFILSWPEHERPANNAVFDAAAHALKTLGLGDHQYVIAVHANTDNLHCHVAVNRVNPVTFKARHIEWAQKTLHLAARQSELKHGWSDDNGIYIIEADEHGRKNIVLNPDHGRAVGTTVPHANSEIKAEAHLPTWHDPESLESWLKTKVGKDLKRALSQLNSWQGLHSWFSNYDIQLLDSGGGGMRLRAMSPETGEEFDIAASRGLKLLKRAELEKRWGKFRKAFQSEVVVPDLSHLNPIDLQDAINDVLTIGFDEGIPPHHILHATEYPGGIETHLSRGVHELPAGGLDADRPNGSVLLPYPLQEQLGTRQSGHDLDVRRAGPVEKSRVSTGTGRESKGNSERSLRRDDSKRAERKAERAAARADLRIRFSQYKKFVALGDTGEDGYFARMDAIRMRRKAALKETRDRAKAAHGLARKNAQGPARYLQETTEIDMVTLREKLQVQADFEAKHRALQATRRPPLSWREWLFEQSKLGDTAALSALRGIVYQAQRDASRRSHQETLREGEQEPEEPKPKESSSYREDQFHKAMARLLEEERKETAIRAAQRDLMRPYEADSLLIRYAGVKWSVTGNGNVKYSDHAGKHLFTDRGNRITFDRVYVTDTEIRWALAHAQQKFGRELTLTGDDPVFTRRMARLADEMGIAVLNPEMQHVIFQHRIDRALQTAPVAVEEPALPPPPIETRDARSTLPIPNPLTSPAAADYTLQQPLSAAANLEQTPEEPGFAAVDEKNEASPIERLRTRVLAIDPRAKFVMPDPDSAQEAFHGVVVTSLENGLGFAQHVGRGVFVLHSAATPGGHDGEAIEVKYINGEFSVHVSKGKDERGR